MSAKPGPAGIALGRHEQEVAAGLEHAHHLGEERLVVLDVLEEVDRGDDIERRRSERKLPFADLQHSLPDELLGRPGVVALEVRADPGAAPLRGESER